MKFDIVIVGGGLVGAGLAVALRQTNLRVALVDARMPTMNDPRLFALNHGSCQFLDHLGVWSQLTMHVSPIHQVHVSRRGHFGAVRLHREDVALPFLGHVIPAKYIEAALNKALNELPNLTVYRPATLKSLVQNSDSAALTIETTEGECVIEAAMVIGADGTASTVREQAGIDSAIVDYGQSALVTRTTLQRSHQHIAYERFVKDGAIAMLPLGENECATIWTAPSSEITELASLSEDEFLKRLQQMFGYRLGRMKNIHERHVFPLRMVRAKKMCEGRVLLLGNSAHTVHPIAAQGFNLALYEVAVLVECLLEKIMDLSVISERVQKQQAVSIGVSHRLSQLFSSESLLINAMTQLGMASFDAVLPLKKKFVNGILGRTGTVPRLLLDVNG